MGLRIGDFLATSSAFGRNELSAEVAPKSRMAKDVIIHEIVQEEKGVSRARWP